MQCGFMEGEMIIDIAKGRRRAIVGRPAEWLCLHFARHLKYPEWIALVFFLIAYETDVQTIGSGREYGR